MCKHLLDSHVIQEKGWLTTKVYLIKVCKKCDYYTKKCIDTYFHNEDDNSEFLSDDEDEE